MSRQTRPKPTYMTVCDICDKELPEGEPGECGSLTHGWIAHPATIGEGPTIPRSIRWVTFMWPPAERLRKSSWEQKQTNKSLFRQRHYDFHAECILRVVEAAVIAAENEREATS